MERVERIPGVDVARGLAVLGMFTAHLAPGAAGDPWPLGAVQVADGRSAATFVVLAGLSVALLSGADRPVDGVRRIQARTRVLVRGVLLVALGVALVVLGTPVAVILPVYGVYFAVATAFLGSRPRTLVALAGAVAIVGPVVTSTARDWLLEHGRATALTDLVVGEHYPAATWSAYVLAGLAVGRLDLRSPRVRRVLLLVGTGLALVAHLGSAIAVRVVAGAGPDGPWYRYLTTEPHSGSTPEVLANTGVALALLAACLAAGDRWPRTTAPLGATGALALTAYSVHVVAIAALGTGVVWEPTTRTWLTFLVVTVVACTAWRTWLGRGPLERVLHVVSTRASDLAPDRVEPRGDGRPAAADQPGRPGFTATDRAPAAGPAHRPAPR